MRLPAHSSDCTGARPLPGSKEPRSHPPQPSTCQSSGSCCSGPSARGLAARLLSFSPSCGELDASASLTAYPKIHHSLSLRRARCRTGGGRGGGAADGSRALPGGGALTSLMGGGLLTGLLLLLLLLLLAA
jgi:hypothetical protein